MVTQTSLHSMNTRPFGTALGLRLGLFRPTNAFPVPTITMFLVESICQASSGSAVHFLLLGEPSGFLSHLLPVASHF